MNTFQERSNALTGSACLEKAFDVLHLDARNVQDGYVKPARTYRQVGDQESVQTGDYGTAIAGDSGTAMTGESGTAVVGDRGSALAGVFGTASAGEWGHATVGDGGVASVLTCGVATAGSFGTASAGDYGTACVGANGTASAGVGGAVCAGELSEIRLKYWDEQAQRYRTVTGYIGENGLESNAHYKLNDEHVFTRASLVDQVGRLRNGQ
ncbi:hypothetical protein [Pseudomonas sp. FFUP_PS_473]|uniref:hypothetical protein n=1 Tax=Pseudomonas sp. FFUP_PS_473 TaxID=2060418 RepID=UPI002113D6E8|nr:hypothetical protein [Pseudomonas sp. FFUP_PS_473]